MAQNEIEEIQNILNNEVYEQKNNLISDIEELRVQEDENNFLLEIANDYKRYQKHILEEREKQVSELLKVLDYLDEIIKTQAITKYTLTHNQNEQKRIINEIKILQKEMNTLM